MTDQSGTSGQLECHKNGSATVGLSSTPRRVEVHFVGEQVFIPCAPMELDEVSWAVEEGVQRGRFIRKLVITWKCAAVRTVEWNIDY